MTLKVPNASEATILGMTVNKTPQYDPVLKLFQNNVTPGETDTESTYTEADFSGYAAKTLTGASWTVTPGAPSVASYAQQTFESDADQTPQTIYGYYIVQATSGLLLWAEALTSPQVVQNNGDQVKITPRFTQKDETD